MEYKGYVAKVAFDDEAQVFHGEVINTRDVITFEGVSVDEIRRAFEDSVDDYLAFCAERGEDPDRPFSGRFMLRVDPALHRKIAIRSRQDDKSLNQWIADTLESVVSEE